MAKELSDFNRMGLVARTNEGGRQVAAGRFFYANKDVLRWPAAMRSVFFILLKEEAIMNFRTDLRVLGTAAAVFLAASGLSFGINLTAPMEPLGPASCTPALELPTGHDNLVDINSAPRDWLVWLGIDETLAGQVISQRPYQARTDLLTKGILPREIYDRVKNRIIARQV